MAPPLSAGQHRVLGAVVGLIHDHGIAEMGMEAVAAAAKLTKGGLLHHFKTMRELVWGLALRVISALELNQPQPTSTTTTRAPWAAAYLKLRQSEPMNDATRAAVLAALIYDRSYINILASNHGAWQDRMLQEARDPGVTLVVRLAADALIFNDVLGFAKLSPEARAQIWRTLCALAETT